jgi:hypothetical protein
MYKDWRERYENLHVFVENSKDLGNKTLELINEYDKITGYNANI